MKTPEGITIEKLIEMYNEGKCERELRDSNPRIYEIITTMKELAFNGYSSLAEFYNTSKTLKLPKLGLLQIEIDQLREFGLIVLLHDDGIIKDIQLPIDKEM